jgi:hypothetical protein
MLGSLGKTVPSVSTSCPSRGTSNTRWAQPLAITGSKMSISSTLVHRAEIRFHEPADALRPFVGCFWVVTAERGATIRVVPDGSTAISMQVKKGQPSEWFLCGPLLRPDERGFTSPAMLIGIRLRPGVAFILSRIPMQTLVGKRVHGRSPRIRKRILRSSALDTRPRSIRRGDTRSLDIQKRGRFFQDPLPRPSLNFSATVPPVTSHCRNRSGGGR